MVFHIKLVNQGLCNGLDIRYILPFLFSSSSVVDDKLQQKLCYGLDLCTRSRGGNGINRYPSFFIANKPPLDLPFFTFSKLRSSDSNHSISGGP